MKRKIPILVCLCVVFFILIGLGIGNCQSSNVHYGDEVLLIPKDNRTATNNGCLTTSTKDGYLECANIVNYYDAKSGDKVTICGQTGCRHRDSTCQAWVGQTETYLEYSGLLYASVTLGDTGYQLICKDLSSGKVTVLDIWENTEDAIYHVYINTISDSIMMITVTSLESEPGEFYKKEKNSLWLYDLKTMKKRQFLAEENLNMLSVIGYSLNYAVVQYTPMDQNLLSQQAFEMQYGEGYSYARYLERASYRELRLYDMETQEYIVVADSKENGFVRTVDPCRIYDKQFVYQCEDTMYLLDLDTGESEEVVTADNIVNYWVMDEKIFLITSNMDTLIDSHPDEEASFWYIGFHDRELVQLENDGRSDVMVFGIYQEGGTFFIGLWNNGTYLISKEDFYAERYENARQIG